MDPIPAPISSFTSVEENGIVELSPDRVYKGSLIHGVPNGEGIVIDPCVNEVIYDGMWQDGLYHGMGTLYVQGEPSGSWRVCTRSICERKSIV